MQKPMVLTFLDMELILLQDMIMNMYMRKKNLIRWCGMC